MEKKSLFPLQAISPTIDYKEFYLNYHKRKKNLLFLREKDLPQIKTNTETNNNSIDNTNTIYRTNNILNISFLSPLKTNVNNSTLFPKLNTVKPRLKNFKLQIKNKNKKEGKLSMKYFDIFNMNKSNKLLIYEMSKKSKFDEEMIKYIFDPIEKKKIFNKLDIIEKKTNKEFENIMNNTSQKEKKETLKFFTNHPKIINLFASEIFKGFNSLNNNNKKANNNEEEITKDINNKNIIKKKEEKNDITEVKNFYKDFLDCIKNSIMRKIELRNQYNQEISIEYIEKALRNELEKIKILISLYLDEEQNEDILFNPEGQTALTEKKRKIIKNMKTLDKSIKKLFQLHEYYYHFIKAGYDEENYKINKNTKNENTQYNYKDLIEGDNNRYNTRNEYLKNIFTETGNYKKINNMNFYKEKKSNDYSDNKGIFSRFKRFYKNEKNESNIYSLKKKDDFIYNETNNEFVERRTIYTNKTKSEKKDENGNENNNDNLNDSKNYKVIIEDEKIMSMNNKDILSIFDRTKYNDDKRKSNNKTKTNYNTKKGKIYLNNEDNKTRNATNEYIKNKNTTKEYYTKNKNEKNEYIKNEEMKKEYVKNENAKNEITINAEKNKENENKENENKKKYNENNNYDETPEENKKMNMSSNYETEEEIEEEENFINSKLSLNNNEIENNSKKENIEQSLNENTDDNKNLNNISIIEQQKKKPKLKKVKKNKNKDLKERQEKSKEKTDLIKTVENSESKENINTQSNKKIKNELIINEVKRNLTVKNANKMRKSKISSQAKKFFSSKKGNLNFFNFENNKKSLIKNFEVIDKQKIFKRNLSYDNISKNDEKNKQSSLDKDQVNIIKLQEDDVDQIVNFINEEEKRKIRIEKNNEIMNKEETKKKKTIKKENKNNNINNLLGLKSEDEENYKEISREDFLEKLKRNDSKIRKYIEDIIKAGLTMGNKKLSKQMKNKSILIFKGINLGSFKFKNKFGIKGEINLKPFRPLSYDKKIQEEKKNEKEKKEKENKKIKINDYWEEKEKKREEAKKKLIYDNRYLFKKKKESIKYMLRKEVEEILKGGIILQQKVKEEEEEKIEIENRFLPPKRPKFVKKKKNRKKLFRRSIFLKDINHNIVESIKEYSSNSSSKIKEESSYSFEEKMQNFIDKIKKLKKSKEFDLDDIDELNIQRNKRDKKEKEKENRMQGFLHTLNEYRDTNKIQRKKNNNFSYKMPLLISTNSDIDKNNSLINLII